MMPEIRESPMKSVGEFPSIEVFQKPETIRMEKAQPEITWMKKEVEKTRMEKVPEEPDSPSKRTKIDMSLYGYKEPPKEEVIEFDGDFDKLFKQKPKTIKGMLTLM